MTEPENEFQQEALQRHNDLRELHSAPPLQWSEKLAASALDWAKELADRSHLIHSNSSSGENLALLYNIPLKGKVVSDMWYSEIKDYDFSDPRFSSETGHFTQLVWVDSKEFGIANCRKNGYEYIVAHYSPPGNYVGKFKENVLPINSISNTSSSVVTESPRPVSPLETILRTPENLQITHMDVTNDIYEKLDVQIFEYNNKLRNQLGFSPLKWDSILKTSAQNIVDSFFQSGCLESEVPLGQSLIILSFEGKLPIIEEITAKIYPKANGDSRLDMSSSPKGSASNPIREKSTENMGCSHFSNLADRLCVALIYSPGKNVRIIHKIKTKTRRI
ncbi:Golgi-associated plant pathogenesis-related protein 1 [Thelohanellus kitauei]|uniref:Golgi-associated plant pathogenesis-related protein 1 n=1 Tax=Thelohanellus kitauei TaxID=669202 RepID=A0A0C2NBM2_THEKT|nr:Golgi-associated plant pathogenesis-related protein 1 [Thelohanellus kitauei]